MTDAPTRPPVRHDALGARFLIALDGHQCELDYVRDGTTLVMTHTLVPPPLEGRGLAGLLVAEAMTWARANALKVVPRCSYVAAWVRRHPEVQDLLAS